MEFRKIMRFSLVIAALTALAALYYLLLPVAIQSRLSADHVRRVFGHDDIMPVVGESLSPLWTSLLMVMKSVGLGVTEETFATSAALSAWFCLGAVSIFAFTAPFFAGVLLALTPAILWTAVVPNGFALSFLCLALMSYFSNPTVRFESRRVRWTCGAVIDGLSCSLNPFAWLIVIWREFLLRSRGERTSRQIRIIRVFLFVAGFSFPIALGILVDADRSGLSFAALPVLTLLRELSNEDVLSAGRVILGFGGEIALGFAASLSFFVAVLLVPGWSLGRKATGRASEPTRSVKYAILILPFTVLLIWGNAKAWKIAVPGWNTIIEDFAENVERSISTPTVAVVKSSTEEAALRYGSDMLAKVAHVAAFRLVNVFEASTVERIQKKEPKYQAYPPMPGDPWAPDVNAVVEKLIVPNVQRGVQFWLDFPPARATGFQAQFLGNGIRVAGGNGPTKFSTERTALRATYIRARPSLHEFLAGPSVETGVFGRYAIYHLAVARILEHEKKTVDWEHRARGEYYAALKKVEWLHEAHRKACSEPKRNEVDAIAVAAKDGRTLKPTEPLDICVETDWYYRFN